jgi:hypothetical protein
MPGSRGNNKVDFSSSWRIIWAYIRRGELFHNFTEIFIPSIFIGTNITRSQAHRAEGKLDYFIIGYTLKKNNKNVLGRRFESNTVHLNGPIPNRIVGKKFLK